MSAIGFNQPLYILPFDHRGSFETKMFGWQGSTSRWARSSRLHHPGPWRERPESAGMVEHSSHRFRFHRFRGRPN